MTARRLMVKSEFVSPWGICDLVGVRFNRSNVSHRLRFGQTKRIASITRAALLLKVPEVETGRSISLKQMIRSSAPVIPKDLLIKEIQSLEADGFVRRTPHGRLQRLNGWLPLQQSLVAIELKLTRIDDAMHQARRNLGFADQSFVGLPLDVARRVAASPDRWGEFFHDGVGLLGVGKFRCRVLIAARKSPEWTDEAIQLYCVDKFWRCGS